MQINLRELGFTCAIVDDDELTVALYSEYVNETPELTLTGAFTNPVEALKFLIKNPVDILFLDVQMPHLSGLDIAGTLPLTPYIIFITSSPDFALQSYALNVSDYLLKPLTESQFKDAVKKAVSRLQKPVPEEGVQFLSSGNDFVYIKIDAKHMRFYLDDIIYIEAEKEYSRLYNTTQTFVTSVSLKTFEELLPKQKFVRTHRSYLVNLQHITSIEADLVHTSKGTLPIGVTYKDGVLEKTLGRRLIK